MRLWICLMAIAVAMAWTVSLAAQETAPAEKPKPEIWLNAPGAAATKAEEAARKDACLRLAEAVYRLPVTGNRDVLDLLLKSDSVSKDLLAALADSKPAGTEYLEDGSVRVTVTTTSDAVVAILKKAYEKVPWDVAEEDSTIAAVANLTKKDAPISGVGLAALAGSLGEKRLPVRRLALARAEQEIAQKVCAIVIGGGAPPVRVRDFALAFKEVPKKMALGLTAVRIRSEEWADDGSVELTAEALTLQAVQPVVLAQSLYDRAGKYYSGALGEMLRTTKGMILQGSGKAKLKEKESPPGGAPLALEMKAVEEALKVVPKDE